MLKAIRRFITSLVVIVLLIVLGLGYLGFMPGISAMFGANQPVDLGLPATEDDRLSANQKFQQTMVSLAKSPDITMQSGLDVIRSGGTHAIDTKLTPPEAAAHLMQMHPFTDLQIKFHPDGTFEAAGKIDTPRIAKYLALFDLTNVAGVDILKTADRYLSGRPTIYVKGTGSISDDTATVKLTAAKIGRIPLATEQFGRGLASYVNAVMNKVPGLEVASLRVIGGQANFVGQVPGTVPEY